jgi:hypothetical protein
MRGWSLSDLHSAAVSVILSPPIPRLGWRVVERELLHLLQADELDASSAAGLAIAYRKSRANASIWHLTLSR